MFLSWKYLILLFLNSYEKLLLFNTLPGVTVARIWYLSRLLNGWDFFEFCQSDEASKIVIFKNNKKTLNVNCIGHRSPLLRLLAISWGHNQQMETLFREFSSPFLSKDSVIPWNWYLRNFITSASHQGPISSGKIFKRYHAQFYFILNLL